MADGTTLYQQITEAIATLIGSDPFFPPLGVGEPEAKDMRANIPGAVSSIKDHAVLQDDGLPEVTRDGGEELAWELEGHFELVYLVQGGKRHERRARREAGVAHLAALIEANRSLGLGDPQIYAELQPAERADELVVKGAAGFSLVLVPIHVQYVARSAAG